MANNINVIVLEGRLARDASEGYKKSADGQTAYGSFTIAVNRSKKVDGQWVEQASFVDCKGFGKQYDYAVPRMTKGSMVRVVGHLEQDKWTGKDGQQKSKIVVVVEQFSTDYKKDGQGQSEQAPQPSGEFEENLPF